MRALLMSLIPLAACSTASTPFAGLVANPVQTAAQTERRAQLEVFVKSNHPALIDDIAAGGGPTLGRAMDLAGIPAVERPARLIQMRADISLYRAAPGALVTSLLLWSS